MRKIILILPFLFIIACSKEKSDETGKAKKASRMQLDSSQSAISDIIHEEESSSQSSLKEIEVDFFSIGETAFKRYKKAPSQWFISADGNSRLYFIPYTDYSITTAILTAQEISDDTLIQLLQAEGIAINEQDKSIELKKIISQKGIKLGLDRENVLRILGSPKSEKKVGDSQILNWEFLMKGEETDAEIGGLKPFILNGLGFSCEMEFQEGKLRQLIYRYDVP